MRGRFISLEGTEGSGKTTQLELLVQRLLRLGQPVRCLREPGSTPVGEEIRHTLQHSAANRAMTAETELLLICAARAQLVREIIRPALAAGDLVVCDRFYDSTTAYQGYGRQLDLEFVRRVIDFAVGDTRPELTLLLHVPVEVSEARRLARQALLPLPAPPTGPAGAQDLLGGAPWRDRMEEADRDFFRRVEQGYLAIAAAEPQRVRVIDATRATEEVAAEVWSVVAAFLGLTEREPD